MCRVPVMNGITLHDGAVIYAVEEVLRAAFGGYLSFAETALGVSVEETSTERLLVSHYLGRWLMTTCLHLFPLQVARGKL